MSRPLVVSSLTLQYVWVRVSATLSGTSVDPTLDTVQMAFTQAGAEPSGGDWKTAVWDTDPDTTPPTYWAGCLVGPAGTVALSDGDYAVWTKVIDAPEVPVQRAGRLTVT